MLGLSSSPPLFFLCTLSLFLDLSRATFVTEPPTASLSLAVPAPTPTTAPLFKRQDPSDTADSSSSDSDSSSSSSSDEKDIDDTAPAGGVSMIEPDRMSPMSFYKLMPSSSITLSWELTSVRAAPSSLTVQAFCSANGVTYDVSPETGLPGDTSEYVWSPLDDRGANDPVFAQASYTLRIFDEEGWDAVPKPGHLSPFAGAIFGLYSPAPYTGIAEGWTCDACSDAQLSIVLPTVLATATVGLLSFILAFYRRLA